MKNINSDEMGYGEISIRIAWHHVTFGPEEHDIGTSDSELKKKNFETSAPQSASTKPKFKFFHSVLCISFLRPCSCDGKLIKDQQLLLLGDMT